MLVVFFVVRALESIHDRDKFILYVAELACWHCALLVWIFNSTRVLDLDRLANTSFALYIGDYVQGSSLLSCSTMFFLLSCEQYESTQKGHLNSQQWSCVCFPCRHPGCGHLFFPSLGWCWWLWTVVNVVVMTALRGPCDPSHVTVKCRYQILLSLARVTFFSLFVVQDFCQNGGHVSGWWLNNVSQ